MINPDTIKCIPEMLRSLCLNSKGLDLVKETRAVPLLVKLFVNRKHLRDLDTETFSFLSKSTEEIFRHFPVLLSSGLTAVKENMQYLATTKVSGAHVAMC